MVRRRYYANDMTSVTCEPLKTMTVQAIFLLLSCFLCQLGEPKPIEKWSTYMYIKIGEGSLSDLKKRFVLDSYKVFQEKARKCDIDKLDFSISVKHKKPDPPDFPSGRLFTVSFEDKWKIYQEKNMSLSVSFPGFCISSVIRVR